MVAERKERLEFELQALRAAGYEYRIVSGDVARNEEFTLEIDYPGYDTPLILRVVFPVLYPYFRFQIYAPTLTLAHHQHPFDKNLCLIGRPTDRWSKKFTLVDFLQNQVPAVLAAGDASAVDDVVGIEEEQAEPVSEYYPYHTGAILLIDGEWPLPEGESGELLIGFSTEHPELPFRGFVLEVHSSDGRVLSSAADGIQAHCRSRRKAHWIRLGAPILGDDPKQALERTLESAGIRPQRQAAEGASFVLLATLFPEEHKWRELSGTGWLSILDWRRSHRTFGRRRAHKFPSEYGFIRTARCGPADLRARVPELMPLSDKSVLLVGLGCIGSAIALELAQAGIRRIKLLDGDHFDPGTTVRWPLGAPHYGESKAAALATFIRENYPLVAAAALPSRIGTVTGLVQSPEVNSLQEALAECSVVVDATAEHGVQRFLSEMCRLRGVPYVWAWGTRGGWGGFVGRVKGGNDACWACVELAMHESAVPTPPEDETGVLQPLGCGDPTFTGNGFDLHVISLAAVRCTVATLSSGANGYRDRPWNVEIVSLRAPRAGPIAPSWTTHDVARRRGCPVCGDG